MAKSEQAEWYGGPWDGSTVYLDSNRRFQFKWAPELNGKTLPVLKGQVHAKQGRLLWRDVQWTSV